MIWAIWVPPIYSIETPMLRPSYILRSLKHQKAKNIIKWAGSCWCSDVRTPNKIINVRMVLDPSHLQIWNPRFWACKSITSIYSWFNLVEICGYIYTVYSIYLRNVATIYIYIYSYIYKCVCPRHIIYIYITMVVLFIYIYTYQIYTAMVAWPSPSVDTNKTPPSPIKKTVPRGQGWGTSLWRWRTGPWTYWRPRLWD